MIGLSLPFETTRLRIRRLEPGDLAAFLEFMLNPDYTRYLMFPDELKTEAGATGLFEQVVAAYDYAEPVHSYAIALRDSNQYVGSCGCADYPEGGCEIYYALNPQHTGFGYATEAATALLEQLPAGIVVRAFAIRATWPPTRWPNVPGCSRAANIATRSLATSVCCMSDRRSGPAGSTHSWAVRYIQSEPAPWIQAGVPPMRPSLLAAVICVLVLARTAAAEPPRGFTELFNGKDFTNWKVPQGDNGHWKILDGVIDYDARSEATGDKNLWTQQEYGDFTLLVDWKIKDTPYINPRVPIIRHDGTHKKGPDGQEIKLSVPDSDSGIFLRGQGKSQVNIWCWPIGSGEVYGYRMDKSMSAAVRAGVTPRVCADNDIGEWNTFEITVKGNRLWVKLNGQQVLENAELPGLPAKGPLALQHHGGMRDGKWTSPPALVQFRNIYIKELK